MARASALALTLFIAAAFAHSAVAQDVETWSCAYKGAWTTDNSPDKGDFKWLVKWERTEGGWHIIGDYNDSYGASFLDGNCADKKCDLTQTYTSGTLNGKVYNWSGAYTDKADGAGKTVNTFTGTWSDASGKGNNGQWAAEAVCTKL